MAQWVILTLEASGLMYPWAPHHGILQTAYCSAHFPHLCQEDNLSLHIAVDSLPVQTSENLVIEEGHPSMKTSYKRRLSTHQPEY